MKSNKFVKVILENAALMLTIALILVLFLFMFSTYGFRDKIDSDFWVRLTLTGVIQVLMIGVWLPEGKKRAEGDERYLLNKNILEEKITLASAPEHLKVLEEFCDYTTEKNREAAVAKRLARVEIAYSVYVEKKDEAEWLSSLPAKSRIVVNYLKTHSLRVRRIKVTEVIGHSSIALAFDVWNHEKAATGMRAIVKLITSAAISILCAVMIFGKKDFNMQMIVDFGFWLMTIGCTVFFSLRTGKQLVLVTRMDYIVRNIDFLNAYDAYRIERGLPAVTTK